MTQEGHEEETGELETRKVQKLPDWSPPGRTGEPDSRWSTVHSSRRLERGLFLVSSEEMEVEVEKPAAAAEVVVEVVEVTTEVLRKEEPVEETVLTVTAAVGGLGDTSETEDKEPEEAGEVDEGGVEEERMWTEEEEGRAKKLVGPWESEVRLCVGSSRGR